MTLRISKTLLIVLGVFVLAGAAVAVYFTVIKSDAEVCYSSTGTQVGCGDAGALTKEEYDEQQAAAAKAHHLQADCEQQIGHILHDAQALDSRLDVGLSYDEYNKQVGNVSVAYNQIPIKSMGQECLNSVGVHLEEAFNDYIKAGNIWNDCLTNFSCNINSIDPQLQHYWLAAATDIGVAKRGLDDMGKVQVGGGGGTPL